MGKRQKSINNMTPEEVDALSVELGNQVRAMCDKFSLRVNKTLKKYGMSAKIAIVFDELPKEIENLADGVFESGKQS